MNLEIFPLGQDHFNRTAIIAIGFILSNQTFKPPPYYGPFYFISDGYAHYAGNSGVPNRIFILAHLSDHQLSDQIALTDLTKTQTNTISFLFEPEVI